jgi:hypothetical protein
MKTNIIQAQKNLLIAARVVYVAIICFACFQSSGQGTLQITFDGPPVQASGTGRLVTNYVESRMFFTQRCANGTNVSPITQFTRNGGGISGYPDDGTAFLQAGGLAHWLVCQFTNGSVFNFLSVDLAEYSTVFQSPLTVHFDGYRPDGSTVALDQTTDGIIDGTGPLADFQTFYFQGFTGLSRLEISSAGAGFSLDNLVVGVPEPATTSLLGVGAVSVLAWRSKKLAFLRRRS